MPRPPSPSARRCRLRADRLRAAAALALLSARAGARWRSTASRIRLLIASGCARCLSGRRFYLLQRRGLFASCCALRALRRQARLVAADRAAPKRSISAVEDTYRARPGARRSFALSLVGWLVGTGRGVSGSAVARLARRLARRAAAREPGAGDPRRGVCHSGRARRAGGRLSAARAAGGIARPMRRWRCRWRSARANFCWDCRACLPASCRRALRRGQGAALGTGRDGIRAARLSRPVYNYTLRLSPPAPGSACAPSFSRPGAACVCSSRRTAAAQVPAAFRRHEPARAPSAAAEERRRERGRPGARVHARDSSRRSSLRTGTGPPHPEIVLNPRFELGSVLHGAHGRRALTRGGDVLLMDADVLYDERIMRGAGRRRGARSTAC